MDKNRYILKDKHYGKGKEEPLYVIKSDLRFLGVPVICKWSTQQADATIFRSYRHALEFAMQIYNSWPEPSRGAGRERVLDLHVVRLVKKRKGNK